MFLRLIFTVLTLSWLLPALVLSNDVWTEEIEIIQLNQDNFNSTIKKYSNLLINFYTPECPHCVNFKPIYVELAKKLIDLKVDIKLAKVDISVEKGIGKQNNIKSIPTLLLFRQMRPTMQYTKQHDADQLLEWIIRKIGEPAREITSVEESEQVLKENHVTIYGFFGDLSNQKARNFIELADQADDHAYIFTTAEEIQKYYSVSPNSIYLFKNYPLEETTQPIKDTSSVKKIQEFIIQNSTPEPVTELNGFWYDRIISSLDYTRTYYFIFLSTSAGHFNGTHIKNVTQLCKETRNDQFFCATIDVDDTNNEQYMDKFNVKAADVPTIRFVYFGDDQIEVKNMAGKSFDEENLRYFSDKLSESFHLKQLPGQDLPQDWDHNPVKILVKRNFYDVVQDKEKDVVVLFYAVWEFTSKRVYKIWNKVGEKYANETGITIAAIETSKNEFEETYYMEKIPTIRFYQRGGKNPVDFKGNLDEKWIEKFIDAHRSKPTKEEL